MSQQSLVLAIVTSCVEVVGLLEGLVVEIWDVVVMSQGRSMSLDVLTQAGCVSTGTSVVFTESASTCSDKKTMRDNLTLYINIDFRMRTYHSQQLSRG